MKQLFDSSSAKCSKIVTKTYSTSFSLGIKLIRPKIRNAIYGIYGFVRYADEIVDSFYEYDQEALFLEFEEDYHKSLERKISLNPILNAFQKIVIQYELHDLVDDFMTSMKADLYKKDYNLKPYAMRLGSAFQKVNFLRDIKDDYEILGRAYFPNLGMGQLDKNAKDLIIKDIENDFNEAYKGIVLLPTESKLGVFLAYAYYKRLLIKLKNKKVQKILTERTRISNPVKATILISSYVQYKFNIL